MEDSEVEAELVERVTKDDIKEVIAIIGTKEEAEASVVQVDNKLNETTVRVKGILGQLTDAVAERAKAFWDWIVGWFRRTFLDPQTGKVVIVTVVVSLLMDLVMPFLVTLITLGVFGS